MSCRTCGHFKDGIKTERFISPPKGNKICEVDSHVIDYIEDKCPNHSKKVIIKRMSEFFK